MHRLIKRGDLLMTSATTKSQMKEALLITSGDLRQAANIVCWPAQEELERKLVGCFVDEGVTLRRAFPMDASRGHGFISSQRMGMDIFSTIDPDANLVFATAAWQYSHHVLPGLRYHRGPILTVANWSGQWPGLVGLLNLNGSLVKAGVNYSSLWSEQFDDQYFLTGLREWINDRTITHDLSHVRPLQIDELPRDAVEAGNRLAREQIRRKAILGVFDEGCMGMYNAIIDDELLNAAGVFKERLSQSALVARMRMVSDDDAIKVREWLDSKGIRFITGEDERSALTDAQIHQQCKMYIAAVRIADEYGCDAIGIQYQQGLKDTVPASDLAEGLLNNPERPPVFHETSGQELFAGKAIPHFNEVDECAGLDALITNRCWSYLDLDPSTTLHDVRWGEHYSSENLNEFVWVLQISGAAPTSHFVDGYRGSSSERQPAMYFPLGGGTLKGIGRPGRIVWSRVFVEKNALHVDMGLGSVVELPHEETMRRWKQTTFQWPMVSATFDGISRDSFMARHRANHINIAYGTDSRSSVNALALKAAMFQALGVQVHLCGRVSFQ
jgi:L-fucose isomerase-like protein